MAITDPIRETFTPFDAEVVELAAGDARVDARYCVHTDGGHSTWLVLQRRLPDGTWADGIGIGVAVTRDADAAWKVARDALRAVLAG